MKKSELRSIIKEEIQTVLSEKLSLTKKDEQILKKLLVTKGDNISDNDIHNFADKYGYNVHELEAYIYKLAAKAI